MHRTTRNMKTRKEKVMKNSKMPLCPLCKSPLVKRQNGRTKTWFYGCSSFPSCKYSHTIDVESVSLNKKAKACSCDDNGYGDPYPFAMAELEGDFELGDGWSADWGH